MKKRVISTLLALLIMIPLVMVPAYAFNTISFTKTTKVNTTLSFTKADFLNRIEPETPTEGAITSVTITDLPALGGTLKLGTLNVSDGQTIDIDVIETLDFVPTPNFIGTATFKYTASIGATAATNVATPSTVNIVVTDILPIAKDLTFTTGRNTPLTENLVGTDEKNRYLTYSVTQPATGKVSNPGNTGAVFTNPSDSPAFVFTPAADETGKVTFTYKVIADDGKESLPGTVTIYVGGAPVANDQTVTVVRNTPKTIKLTSTDPENRLRSYAIVTQPKFGTLTPTAPGSDTLTYRPQKDYLGSDSFTFRVSVASGAIVSAPATITINVEKYAITPIVYADMTNHWGATSAGSLAGLGFVVGEKITYATGTTITDKYYFHPEEKITRGEFLLFLTSVMKIEPDATMSSPFHDNVPDWLLGPSNALNKKNIVEGTLVGTKRLLKQDQVLNRLEAMTLLDRAMTLTSKTNSTPTFVDMAQVPAWGVQAIKNLSDYGIVVGNASNELKPFDPMTRAEAAEMLFKVYKQAVLETK